MYINITIIHHLILKKENTDATSLNMQKDRPYCNSVISSFRFYRLLNIACGSARVYGLYCDKEYPTSLLRNQSIPLPNFIEIGLAV